MTDEFNPDWDTQAVLVEEIQRMAKRIEELEAKGEPAAYPEGDVVGPCICGSWPGGKCLKCPRITPPQRKPLTDEQAMDAYFETPPFGTYKEAFIAGIRFIEATHGIKGEA